MTNANADYKAQKKQEVADLLQTLALSLVALTSTEGWKRYLTMQRTFHKYSFRNVLLILAQKPEASQVAGYRAWQKLGRQVRKGEKALTILAPTFRKYQVETSDGVEDRRSVYFRAVKVFDVSQTEGEDLPTDDLCQLLDGHDEKGERIFELLSSFATSIGYSVTKLDGDIPECPDANGYCQMVKKEIVVAGRAPLQQAKTLAHEIGHALMHSENFRDLHEAPNREIEAESFAFCIMNAFGIDSMKYSLGYVAQWAKGDPNKLEASGKAVQAAVASAMKFLEAPLELERLRAENAKLRTQLRLRDFRLKTRNFGPQAAA